MELFDVELFAAVALELEDFVGDLAALALLEDFAGDFAALTLLEDFLVVVFEMVGLRLRDDFERATRTGRFQPTALSARNVRGMETTFSGLSITDATAASARSARTSEITFAGRRARAA